MKNMYRFIALFILAILIVGCSSPSSDSPVKETKSVELTISAAASLQESLEALKASYEKEHATIKITYNFGGSGALQQQIIQGAPVDLFFSAAENKFNELVDKGLIDEKQGTKLLANELVLVVPAGNEQNIQSFKDLKQAQHIALGTPETVPAGQYGVESLKNMGLWNDLEAKVVYTKDVRQVLTYTETGNVEAGLVYKTDALISDKVTVIATAPADTHAPIIYPVGILKDSKHTAEAEAFYQYLQSEEALKTFEKYGFQAVQ
ncbi:molybdate ABC transporter substrate-binding protein [Lysinibacillus piscis]|uniref:ABC transporter substrate-binding lipoprotein YvgL n=1 Tax=Lysinibacillus piscis TaxID=2518931 RepID=A0ABQ5NG06_9BACI|nr:molybdate ABC transporter substrate-binding protein [Lysinibacillus sp. KH24]GLC87007.1 putative ABC transporter substrate-binding lipoprotein YvgL [Lysinibacillus sp. KH24]